MSIILIIDCASVDNSADSVFHLLYNKIYLALYSESFVH